MGGGETAPPPVSNPGKDLEKYIGALSGVMPKLLGLEQTSRPQFGALNLADISQMLGGTTGQTGIIGLGGQATQASQEQIQQARGSEFMNMLGNAGTVNQILGAVSPGSQQLTQAQTGMALDRYNAARSLTPQEARMADQTAREAFAARGRLNDNAAVASEILGREDVLARKRAEAASLGGQAFGQEQQYSSPAIGLLTGSPASVLLGQDYLNRGQQAVGANTPQLVDTGAGINLGQQQASNLASWQQANAASKNAASAQNTQLAASALAAIASIYSDKRVKEDVKKVGKTNEGLPIYTYKYKGSPKTQMGVMAQDVKKKKPSALGPVLGGFMTVDYSKIK